MEIEHPEFENGGLDLIEYVYERFGFWMEGNPSPPPNRMMRYLLQPT